MARQLLAPGYLNQRKRAQEEQVENRKQREFMAKERQKAAMRNFGLGLAQSAIGGIFKELLDVGGEELREAVSGKRRALKGMSAPAAEMYYMNQAQESPDVTSAIMGALDLDTVGAPLTDQAGKETGTGMKLPSFRGVSNEGQLQNLLG